MAENAANFTFITQNQPSIFDVIAQKSLNDTLNPALGRVALFLSTNFPRKFLWFNTYYDEAFLGLNAVLQYYYLKNFDATFSENFYGLKRVQINGKNINEKQRLLCILVSVLMPYFKSKLDSKVNIYKLEEVDGCLRNDFEGNLKKVLIRSHSSFQLIMGLITVANFIQYISKKTQIQLPILHLIKMKLIYSNEEVSSFWTHLVKGQLTWKQISTSFIKSTLTGTLELTAFFLQFLQVWNAHRSNINFTSLPKVNAPRVDNKAKTYQGKCPICLQYWKIPTVLPVSGYVFCFPCILRYLRENEKCPITNLPAKPLDIIRLFDNE